MRPAEDLFDPSHYGRVRQRVEDATTLPPWAYHDPDFHERERARVFARSWCFVGHAGRVPDAGDYFTLDYAGVRLIVVRGRDGQVRCFANSCRHRGASLLEGEGTCRAIQCPYHGWTYGLDGQLTGAPDMEETAGFDRAENALLALGLESWAGFLFVAFEPAGPSLAAWLGDLPTKLVPYGLDDLVLVHRAEYRVACNWKVYVENFMDYYHTPVVHSASLASGSLSAYHRKTPAVERGSGQYMILYGEHEGSAALLPGAPGLPPLPGLDGRAARGSTYACVFPCTLVACTKDCVWFVEIHPRGPEAIGLGVGLLIPRAEAGRPEIASWLAPYIRRLDVSVAEDNAVNEIQQRGVRSPLALAGRVSRLEALSHAFRNWVLDQVIDPA